ncbi:Uncharacterised protein [Legionella quateirensis]|uniref:Uncharacterized protein n=1 Tax=Legionella quateirensis TaxID=45072 RepID=A0A378KT36_9GAMM|nr:hypothetical protein Lqua_0101 [Legionella quateirensis]STY16558.1 Uncharacterised protein [Legionella quateirensis]
MKHSEIREAYAQHSTFLIGTLYTGLQGLRASHVIRATLINLTSTGLDQTLRFTSISTVYWLNSSNASNASAAYIKDGPPPI